MAGENSAATEARLSQSSADPEKGQMEDGTEHRQTERDGHQESGRQPSVPAAQTQALLPPPHHKTEKDLPPTPETSAVRFAPLPPPLPPLPPQPGPQPIIFDRPHYPVWNRAKLVLGTLSLMVSIVIIGVGIALGLHNAPYLNNSYGGEPVDLEFGSSATAAGLAILVTASEFMKIWLTGRPMQPSAHVAFQLFIWLAAAVAVVLIALYSTAGGGYYDYPRSERFLSQSQSIMYENMLLGFDCVLLSIHFVLFVGACSETNGLSRAKRGTIVVEVPVPVPAGAPIPDGRYPVYVRPHSFVSQPGAPPVCSSAPMMVQVGQQGIEGPSPVQPQQAVMYGGYYAPAPPATWTASQQHGNTQLFQGYYAPVTAPTATLSNSARHSSGEPRAPALASSSGSRRSQRQAQAQAQAQTQAETQSQPATQRTEPQEAQQPGQSEEPISGKTA
ncbi:hypothetical protein VTI74DRAFT_2978 [Chaetomium olivicolor]